MKLKLMSHNVWGMYAPDVVKKVANRVMFMRNVYFEYLPDAIGMQEYSEDIINNKLPTLISLYYKQVEFAEDVKAYGMENLYTPIFYRPDTLELCDKGFILFDREYNNHDSKGVAFAVFLHKASGQLFTLCNTHYWWKSGEEHDRARVNNSRVILSLKEKFPEPFFIMGDMNCRMNSDAYKELLGGGLTDVQTAARVTMDSNTHHAYPSYNEATNEFYGAPKPQGNYECSIDHIFVDSGHTDGVERFEIIMSDDACNTSDHCPVGIEYRL